jgi:hypothetical protein
VSVTLKNRDVHIRVRSAIRKIWDVRIRVRSAIRKSQSGHGHEHVFQNIEFICEFICEICRHDSIIAP